MKFIKRTYSFLFLFLSFNLSSQSTLCNGAQPFCAGLSSYTFAASTVSTGEIGPDYGCLGSQPNPAWFYFQVSTSGTIVIDIAGTGGGDVDFICWGPFPTATGNCGNLTAGNTADCSYSGSPTETCTVTGAIVGEFYILLITNFSGITQNIDFGQDPTSTGATDCALLLTSGVTSKTICPGATAILTANSNLVGPTYLWNPGGATTSSISVNPGSTTIYTVTISGMTPTVVSTPTVIVNTGTVTVLPSPTISLTSNNMVCPTSAINLLASSGFTNYTWTGPLLILKLQLLIILLFLAQLHLWLVLIL